jgi:hypothetical protein
MMGTGVCPFGLLLLLLLLQRSVLYGEKHSTIQYANRHDDINALIHCL